MMIDIRLLLNLIICLQCGTTISTANNHTSLMDFLSDVETPEYRTTNDTDIVKESYRDFALRTLMPSSRYCGFQYLDERFDNTRTSNNYPWLVDVLFNKNNYRRHSTDRCSGVLINDRYILTSKICGIFADKVRLGSYNSNWKSTTEYLPDNDVSYQGLGNAGTSIFSTVEEFIEPQDKTDDYFTISLLRLSQTVKYSDYVRPICLPLPQFPNPSEQSSFNGIGWIRVRPFGSLSDILKRKMYTFVIAENHQCCNHTNADNACTSVNTSSYLCLTSSLSSNDFFCGDDNGAPLMYRYKYHWVVGGIINSVHTTDPGSWCSHNGVVDTMKITTDNITWILENIRA